MALTTHHDLLLYELGAMRDGETTGGRLLAWLGSEVRDDELAHLLRSQERESHEHLSNLETCLEALGASPLETPSHVVDGMRAGYETFVQMRPSCEVLDLYALLTAMRFMYFAIGNYKGIIYCTRLINQADCSQSLERNLAQKQASAEALEKIGQRMARELPHPA